MCGLHRKEAGLPLAGVLQVPDCDDGPDSDRNKKRRKRKSHPKQDPLETIHRPLGSGHKNYLPTNIRIDVA